MTSAKRQLRALKTYIRSSGRLPTRDQRRILRRLKAKVDKENKDGGQK
jgi:hypothetical protein